MKAVEVIPVYFWTRDDAKVAGSREAAEASEETWNLCTMLLKSRSITGQFMVK